MAPPGGKDLTYKIFGLDHMGGEVFADVFAKQVSSIVAGLEKIDKIVNGGSRHRYVVAGLEIGSAQIELREKVISESIIKASPCVKLMEVGYSAASGKTFTPNTDEDDVSLKVLASISSRASKDFNYATLRSPIVEIVRVDTFLNRQVQKIIQSAQIAASSIASAFYIGSAFGSFDGVIEAVDLKGDAPAARLILSAGGKPIDCILLNLDISDVRSALGSRVSVSGRAIYEGKTGLPSRIEIRKVRRLLGGSIMDLCGNVDLSDDIQAVWEN
jgi:hypothetical protein